MTILFFGHRIVVLRINFMKISRSILFPFAKQYRFLMEKWWHRLFVVVYVVIIVGLIVVSFLGVLVSIEESDATYNISVKNNLRDFSKNSDKNIANTVPLFLKQTGSVGCLEDNKIGYVSTYVLEDETFCSADISAHLDEAAEKIIGNGTLTVDKRRELLSGALVKDTEKRYCFIPKDINCSSDKVVSYNQSILYYLQVIIFPIIITYLFSLFFQVTYFKGLIYIIYGRKFKNVSN